MSDDENYSSVSSVRRPVVNETLETKLPGLEPPKTIMTTISEETKRVYQEALAKNDFKAILGTDIDDVDDESEVIAVDLLDQDSEIQHIERHVHNTVAGKFEH